MKSKIAVCLLCLLMCAQCVACGGEAKEYVPPQTGEIVGEENPSENNTQQPEEGEGQVTPPTTQTPSTPEPPSETQPPEVVVPQVATDKLLSCTTNGLNVRSGPGTSYGIVGTLDKSDMVQPLQKTGSWYKIAYLNGEAYISASYVKEVEFAVGSDTVERVIDEGKKLLGIPYVYGAQRYHWGNGNLNANFNVMEYDCSSLMQYIFKIGANINLEMTTRTQCNQGTEVQKKDIRRGDLLFFTNASRVNNTGVERIGHVALYLGDNIILHTASDHAVIEPISNQRWSYYITARRMIK